MTELADPTEFGGGRYKVLKLLGRGGQKTVFLVRDTSLERTCALAWFSLENARPDDLARVRREALSLARVGSHPHVVSVHDLGESDGRPFFVTEYLPGGDLAAARAGAASPMPVDEALKIARDTADALDFIHSHGIIHRDLKPENLWLDPQGRVHLGDFGLCVFEGASHLTAEGTILGTPAYMAPEQLRGETVDGRTDLYALGCVLYELLTGRAPFTGPTLAVISQHLHAIPQPPGRLIDALPAPLEAMVLSLLAKSPDDRPASAATVRDALDSLRSASSLALRDTQALSVSAPPRPASSPPAPPRDSAPVSAAPALPASELAPSPRMPPRAPRWLAFPMLAIALLAGVLITHRARPTLRNAPSPTLAAPSTTAPLPTPAPAVTHRLAIVATRLPDARVDGETAWALAARLTESVDRYREFRPISPAGLLAARLTELGSATALPDEAMVLSIARRVRADTVAALAISEVAPGEYTVAVHAFSTADPSDGASSMRERVRRDELDGEGTERMARLLLRALGRQWSVSAWSDEIDASAPAMPFDTWRAYMRAEQYCMIGRYDVCERITREALVHAPDDPLLLLQLSCAVSYQDRDDTSLTDTLRHEGMRARLRSRHDLLVFDQGLEWFRGLNADQRHDRAGMQAAGRRIVALNQQLRDEYGDPIAYLYQASAYQYLLEDVPEARRLYAEARRASPGLYPAWYEDAELVRGAGRAPAQNAEAATLLATFIACNPASELLLTARSDIARWRLISPPGPIVCPDEHAGPRPR